MKAIYVRQYGGPEVLELEDISVPTPGENEVLVRIEAAGVNPVDTYIRAGAHATAPRPPFIPGKDGAGIVEETGPAVRKVKEGSRVYVSGSLSGTYADYAICREDQVWELPEKVSFDAGAGVFVPYATAYRALIQKAEAKEGEKVLIHGGSGAVGIAAIQWAKHVGLEVYATAGSSEGMELVNDLGADHVFDHSSSPEFGYLDEIQETSGGVEIILEMLANKNLVADFRALAKFGRITVIGSRGSLEFDPRLMMTNEATLRGMSLFNAPDQAMEEIHSEIGKGLSEGYLDPVIGKAFSLEDAAEAHRHVIENKAYGKIVLHPRPDSPDAG
ncbi:MAG: NADPH:quinone reductase [Acidobacteria bacterium]|nr:MAG: NADPH:quinone reductase [Acidobacteriota bacterium]REK01945.1 MAG: NADPH:quinone reductase [Acidobacteriota bacterium]REK14901.1 MAG: NADPH:quinone reductase [Acidobacteriota bacterium]REK45616.1 MAG: NADPH:quinone reductase [Acidobacteriota bacterium]